jgi:hypothetical protein
MIKDKKEILKNLVNFLTDKKINVTFDILNDSYVECKYEKYYSSFSFSFYFDEFLEKNNSVIMYHSEYYIKNIKRRKTNIKNRNFCNIVYNNILYIISHYDKISTEHKLKIDTKNKYCSELESHYNKLHKSTYINVKYSKNDIVDILINGYDDDKKTSYDITFEKNKYFLNSKTVYYEKSLKI